MPLNFDFLKAYKDRVKDFIAFKEKYTDEKSDWKNKFSVIETDPKINYGRILLKWNDEACDCENNDCERKTDLKHIYASAIDLKSGDIYLDCRPRKLYIKNLIGIGLRPIVLIGKTLSHIFFIPVITDLAKILCEKKSERNWAEFRIKTWQSIKDIGRTPFYETIMLIMHIVAVVFSAIHPPILYKIRSVIGSLEIKMNRIESTRDLYGNIFICGDGWVLTPCFVPICNLANLLLPKENCHGEEILDENNRPIIEEDTAEHINENLSIKAHRLIEYRQENREPLNDCGKLYPKSKPYISKATPLKGA